MTISNDITDGPGIQKIPGPSLCHSGNFALYHTPLFKVITSFNDGALLLSYPPQPKDPWQMATCLQWQRCHGALWHDGD